MFFVVNYYVKTALFNCDFTYLLCKSKEDWKILFQDVASGKTVQVIGA